MFVFVCVLLDEVSLGLEGHSIGRPAALKAQHFSCCILNKPLLFSNVCVFLR